MIVLLPFPANIMQGTMFSMARGAEPSNKEIRHIHVGYSINNKFGE